MKIQNTEVPEIGFGTFTLDGKDCQESVKDALSIGYRHIDTARMYGNEKYVGQGIKESGINREDIFLTTKLWYDELHYNQVIEKTKESLKDLKTDYVDLLLIHWPSPDGIPLKETLDGFKELQQQGKTKHIGVSNFPPSLLKEAMGLAPVFCNQVEYHPYLSQEKLKSIVQENEIMLTAYCPIAKGKVPNDETLEEIGNKHGKNPAQVALRWLYQQENVAAIPRSSRHENRIKNLDIFDFELTDEEMDRIYGLNRNERLIDPVFAPEWE